MMGTAQSVLTRHWFVPLAAAIVAVDTVVAQMGSITRFVELGLLLEYVAPLRNVGLVVLIFLELAVLRLLFVSLRPGVSQGEVAHRVSAESEMPLWVAKLLAWEFAIWRKILSWGRSLLGRGRDDT